MTKNNEKRNLVALVISYIVFIGFAMISVMKYRKTKKEYDELITDIEETRDVISKVCKSNEKTEGCNYEGGFFTPCFDDLYKEVITKS